MSIGRVRKTRGTEKGGMSQAKKRGGKGKQEEKTDTYL